MHSAYLHVWHLVSPSGKRLNITQSRQSMFQITFLRRESSGALRAKKHVCRIHTIFKFNSVYRRISNRNLLWLAGLGWLAGCWLAGAGRLGLAGWLFVFGRLVGWFVGLSAGYLVCGLACSWLLVCVMLLFLTAAYCRARQIQSAFDCC